MKNRKTILIIIAGIAGLCICCFGASLIYSLTPSGRASRIAQAQTDTARPTSTIKPTSTTAPSNTPKITNTPQPTNTPLPTSTPRPTSTSAPTDIPTKTPSPIVFEGRGNQVLDLNKWDGPAILKITHEGSSNFVVWSYDSAGNQTELLVNTIGNYSGIRPLDFEQGAFTARLQIESEGTWNIQVLPITEMTEFPIPGIYEGQGDFLLFLTGGTPDLLKVDASKAKSNFVVYSFSNNIDLIVNEIAPYEGTSILPSDTIILDIQATGNWKIEVTSK